MFDGPILRLLVRLSAPIFAGMFFQLLYNITDTIWISRIDLSDPSYVGGTGIIFPFLFLAIALANGLMVGTSSLVARAIGEKNYEVLDRTADSGLAIALLLSIVITVLAYLLAKPIITFLGAKGDFYRHAMEYYLYLLPAGVFIFTGSVLHGVLQGEGLMKYVMQAMVIGTVANIILDPIFIFLLKLDIRGAALATVIAQALTFFYIAGVFLRRKTLVPVHWKFSKIDLPTIGKIATIGFPQALGQILMSFSFLIFNRVVVSIDQVALTAFALCGRFDQLVMMPIFAIGAALVTMAGQNAGRGLFERVQKIWRTSLLAGLVMVASIALLMVLLASVIYPFFSDVDQVVWYAVTQTRIIEFSFIFVMVSILARSVFQAIGYPLPALLIMTMRTLLITVPAVYLLVYVLDLGMYGVWFGLITGSVSAAVISLIWTGRILRRLREGKISIASSISS
ncbi:MAG TPA: MATE family efflux transporter [bacterium]|nr:MATE family efflux transporter [bacterium]